jgi:hypothetical protein
MSIAVDSAILFESAQKCGCKISGPATNIQNMFIMPDTEMQKSFVKVGPDLLEIMP